MNRVAVVLQVVGLVLLPAAAWGLWGAWWALLVLAVACLSAGVAVERDLA